LGHGLLGASIPKADTINTQISLADPFPRKYVFGSRADNRRITT
jgi:hypothetical protein